MQCSFCVDGELGLTRRPFRVLTGDLDLGWVWGTWAFLDDSPEPTTTTRTLTHPTTPGMPDVPSTSASWDPPSASSSGSSGQQPGPSTTRVTRSLMTYHTSSRLLDATSETQSHSTDSTTLALSAPSVKPIDHTPSETPASSSSTSSELSSPDATSVSLQPAAGQGSKSHTTIVTSVVSAALALVIGAAGMLCWRRRRVAARRQRGREELTAQVDIGHSVMSGTSGASRAGRDTHSFMY